MPRDGDQHTGTPSIRPPPTGEVTALVSALVRVVDAPWCAPCRLRSALAGR
jgi:hypothetical protein